jgi:hypothetical protein
MAWTDRTSSIQGIRWHTPSDFWKAPAIDRRRTARSRQVTGLVPLGSVVLAEIDWGGLDLPGKVNVKNLSRVRDGVVMEQD